jgi:hypothetical protein
MLSWTDHFQTSPQTSSSVEPGRRIGFPPGGWVLRFARPCFQKSLRFVQLRPTIEILGNIHNSTKHRGVLPWGGWPPMTLGWMAPDDSIRPSIGASFLGVDAPDDSLGWMASDDSRRNKPSRRTRCRSIEPDFEAAELAPEDAKWRGKSNCNWAVWWLRWEMDTERRILNCDLHPTTEPAP